MMTSRRAFLGGLAAGMTSAFAGGGCGGVLGAIPEVVWGIHGTKPGWLHKPRALAIDANDHLYIADLTDRIQVFDRDGNFLRHWRTPALNVDGPSGLCVDRLGRVLVADTHFYRILVYDQKGEILLQIGDGVQGTTPGRFGYPTDTVVDSKGRFFVTEYGEHDRVQVFSPEGKWLHQWGGHGYDPGQFLRPTSISIDDEDRLYVSDACNHRVQIFDTQGKVLGLWGGRGGEAGKICFAYGLCLGPSNSLYVCEYGNSRVQKFTRDGRPAGTWGGPGRQPGELFNPWAVAVDSQGAVFVVDSGNHRVQRFRL
jgi:DNA-binding beta-propeller fold protein YncE